MKGAFINSEGSMVGSSKKGPRMTVRVLGIRNWNILRYIYVCMYIHTYIHIYIYIYIICIYRTGT